MKASEKAKDIYDQMKGFRVKNSHRKKCALVCVDEIVSAVKYGHEHEWFFFREEENDFLEYWNEVKSEIEKM